MEKVRKKEIIIFFTILFIHIICIYEGWEMGRLVSKLLLLPTLIFYYFMMTRIPGKKGSRWVYWGLLFSFLGDLFLTQSGELFFLVGMLAFIGTHICNSFYFLQLQSFSLQKLRPIMITSILMIILIFVLLQILHPHLGNFENPIIGYMLFIGIMIVLASNTIQSIQYKKIAIAFFIPGATLFVLSDGILALNKFIFHERLLDIMVMLTYGLAQYFLVSGFVKPPTKLS